MLCSSFSDWVLFEINWNVPAPPFLWILTQMHGYTLKASNWCSCTFSFLDLFTFLEKWSVLLFPVGCALMNSAVPTLHATICDFIPCRTTTIASIQEPVKLMQIIGLAIDVPSRNSVSKGCGRYVHVYLIIRLYTFHIKAIVLNPLSFSLAVCVTSFPRYFFSTIPETCTRVFPL